LEQTTGLGAGFLQGWLVFDCRLQRRLQKIEKQRNIRTRWQKGDELYQAHVAALDSKQRDAILNQLLQLSRERRFLLALKSKYAGKHWAYSILCELHSL